MLYVTGSDKITRVWHVGNQLPPIIGHVIQFQADGDELEFIVAALQGKVFRKQPPAEEERRAFWRAAYLATMGSMNMSPRMRAEKAKLALQVFDEVWGGQLEGTKE